MTRGLAALVILFSFLFVSIVHACSGLDGVAMASLYSSSKGPMMAGKPCDHGKPEKDICRSVRHRMLSIRAESIQNDSTLFPSTLPNAVTVEVLLPSGTLLGRTEPIGFGSCFSKAPPDISHVVLRI